jgi:hypothetical protein
MMTDRELLELAAKAAEIQSRWYCGQLVKIDSNGLDVGAWNPLDDDGDALRLAVKLGLDVWAHGPRTQVGNPKTGFCLEQEHYSDPYAATRRAVVRAAAEIGKEIRP